MEITEGWMIGNKLALFRLMSRDDENLVFCDPGYQMLTFTNLALKIKVLWPQGRFTAVIIQHINLNYSVELVHLEHCRTSSEARTLHIQTSMCTEKWENAKGRRIRLSVPSPSVSLI